jgi:transcription antitermination factor NusG
VKQWHDRKKTVEEPLFTSYVFVHISAAEKVEVSKTPGILNFVHWLGKPAVIRAEEIDTIKDFLTYYSNIRLEKTDVSLNDTIRVQSGPLVNREGKVLEVQEGKVLEVQQRVIKVSIPSLGYSLVAQVEKTNVQVIRQEEGQSEIVKTSALQYKIA